jgi:hypothetical protein
VWIALEVETSYGEAKLQAYADDIGVEYETLKGYRSVSGQYEKGVRTPDLPWSVFKVFAAQDDRAAPFHRRMKTAYVRRIFRGCRLRKVAT